MVQSEVQSAMEMAPAGISLENVKNDIGYYISMENKEGK